ncbi:MAG: pantoate--beta-alanine ligase [Bdellovibrio sp.]|nr:MAG: pantoate--beta-alanine ligase [Bdellovibrio sp.]
MNASKASEIKNWRREQNGSVGFVPTMGALHEGHAELLRRARKENDRVVLSIFVNPTQFNDPKDLEKYPRTLDSDLSLARREGVDLVWTPSRDELYHDSVGGGAATGVFNFRVCEEKLSSRFCGAFRPGHFIGVLTVVMKLLQVVKPARAYFGEKDYQQLLLVKQMAAAFFLEVEIIPVPTVRESDGLAMSSRNVRLTAEERKQAAFLVRALRESNTAAEAAVRLGEAGFRVDYVEDFEGRRLAAAWLGEVRLIDNVKI